MHHAQAHKDRMVVRRERRIEDSLLGRRMVTTTGADFFFHALTGKPTLKTLPRSLTSMLPRSKYVPHNGTAERARRHQIADTLPTGRRATMRLFNATWADNPTPEQEAMILEYVDAASRVAGSPIGDAGLTCIGAAYALVAGGPRWFSLCSRTALSKVIETWRNAKELTTPRAQRVFP